MELLAGRNPSWSSLDDGQLSVNNTTHGVFNDVEAVETITAHLEVKSNFIVHKSYT